MNYKQIYENIINYRINNPFIGYTEEHHIVPKCLGGSDKKDNLVRLSAREHFICHLLLTKMYPKGSNEYYKMCHAFLMMLVSGSNQQRYITSRKFEQLRIEAAKNVSAYMKIAQNGTKNSQYGTFWIYNPEIEMSRKIKKNDPIDIGWYIGRVTDWDKFKAKQKVLMDLDKIRKDELDEKIRYYTALYDLYKVGGFKSVKNNGYNKSKVAIVQAFKKYVKEYTPRDW